LRLANHGSEVPDSAYVPFFGAFGAAWDIVASWGANPLACSGRRRMRRFLCRECWRGATAARRADDRRRQWPTGAGDSAAFSLKSFGTYRNPSWLEFSEEGFRRRGAMGSAGAAVF
jgi:hypothetical protein